MICKCEVCKRKFDANTCGKYCSDQCRKKVRSKYHQVYYDKKAYRGNRSKAYERDGYACTICGSEKNLSIHHIDKSGSGNNPNNKLDNLLTVCHSCHHQKMHLDDCVAARKGVYTNCKVCGTEIYSKPYRVKINGGKYCSQKCYHAGRKQKL